MDPFEGEAVQNETPAQRRTDQEVPCSQTTCKREGWSMPLRIKKLITQARLVHCLVS